MEDVVEVEDEMMMQAGLCTGCVMVVRREEINDELWCQEEGNGLEREPGR